MLIQVLYNITQSTHPGPSPGSGSDFSQCKCTIKHTNICLLCLLIVTAHQPSNILVVCVSRSVHRSGGPDVPTAHLFQLIHLGLPRTFSPPAPATRCPNRATWPQPPTHIGSDPSCPPPQTFSKLFTCGKPAVGLRLKDLLVDKVLVPWLALFFFVVCSHKQPETDLQSSSTRPWR